MQSELNWLPDDTERTLVDAAGHLFVAICQNAGPARTTGKPWEGNPRQETPFFFMATYFQEIPTRDSNRTPTISWSVARFKIHQTHFNQAEPWWRASIWRSHRKVVTEMFSHYTSLVVIKQCSYHNNIIDIQNRLPYSKVVHPAIIVLFSLTCALRRSIVLQFFLHVDTRPILPFLFFFNSTFYSCIIIVIFYLMYLIH